MYKCNLLQRIWHMDQLIQSKSVFDPHLKLKENKEFHIVLSKCQKQSGEKC